MIYLISALVFIVAWFLTYIFLLRPLLLKYSVTASLIERIDAAEGNKWQQIRIWLEGKKSAIVLFFSSAYLTIQSAISGTVSTVTGLNPTDLQPLQDHSIWTQFFGDIMAMRIVAAFSLLATFLTIKGHTTATVVASQVATGAPAATVSPAPSAAVVSPAPVPTVAQPAAPAKAA